MKYIRRLGEKEIGDHGKAEVFDFSAANTNEEARVESITTVAGDCIVEVLPLASGFIRGASDLGLGGSLKNNKGMPTFETIAYPGHISVEALRSMNFNGLATFKIKAPVSLVSRIVQHKLFAFYELPQEIDSPFSTIWMQGDVAAFKDYFEICVGPYIPVGQKLKEYLRLVKTMLGLLEKYQTRFYERVTPDE